MKQNGVPNNRLRDNIVATPPSTSDLIMPEPSANSELQQWQFNGLQNEGGALDLDGMNFDDLLLGTGLPQGFISFDYPPNGYLWSLNLGTTVSSWEVSHKPRQADELKACNCNKEHIVCNLKNDVL